MKTLLITLLLSLSLFAGTYNKSGTYKCGTDTIVVESGKLTITDSDGVSQEYEHIAHNFYRRGKLELKWYGDSYELHSNLDDIIETEECCTRMDR